MAPLTLKTTLALLAASGAATSSVAARKNYGKHMKMVRRTGANAGLFEDLDKRENDAPYGYDRCGVARTKPYVRKTGNGASPSPSKQYKPCPDGSPGASQAAARKQAAAAPTPAPNGDGTWNSESGPTTQYHDGSDDGNAEEAADGENDDDDDDEGVYYIAPSGDIVRVAGDGSTQTGYTTQYVDVTSYTTEYTEPTTTQMSSSPAPSADGSSNGNSGNVFSPNAPNVKVVNGAGQAPSSSSSSSSNTWKEESQPTWTPEAQAQAPAPSSSSASWSSSWTPEAEPSPSSSSVSQWTPPHAQVKVVATPSSSSSSEEPAQTPATSNVGRSYGAMGLAWDWQNPKGVLHNWCGKNAKIYTWSAYPPSDPLCDGMEWYPQYWGPAKQGEFEANVASGIIRPGMTILGYNEPDQPGQANLGVWDAIGSYKAQITKYASQGYRITTPGCTSDENGFQWLSQFIAGCAGTCGFTAIQTHFYGTDADAFIAYIQRIHNAWPDFPIIISEYAAETFGHGADLTADQSAAYLAKTQNWLKQQPYVDSYFFFGPLTTRAANGVNHNNLLINDDGSVKPIGWQYKDTA